MLILTRKPGESLYIGDEVVVTVVEIKGNQVRVGIKAPPEKRIYREEIYMQILEENRKAAEGDVSGSALDQLSGGWSAGSREAGAETKGPRAAKMATSSLRGKKASPGTGVTQSGMRGSPQSEGGKE